jgi:hypothetical protein
MMCLVRFMGEYPWIAGPAALAVYFGLFAVYYRRRRRANSREKDDAAHVFADLAQRLGGRYERAGQSRSSLYAYAELGSVLGATATLTYEVGCYPRAFEDVGGRLRCTVRPAAGRGVFDVPAEAAHWSVRTAKRRDSVRALFGRRYAERARGDLHGAIVALVEMSFEVQISPEYLQACAPPEVFDWPRHPDNEAAAAWVDALLALAGAFPRRG